MSMTIAQLHREIADLVEVVEQLKAENEALKIELQATKAQVPAEQQVWFNTKEAAKRIGRSPDFLNQDRIKSPPRIPFRKDSYRVVRYHRSDLDAFNEARRAKKKAKV